MWWSSTKMRRLQEAQSYLHTRPTSSWLPQKLICRWRSRITTKPWITRSHISITHYPWIFSSGSSMAFERKLLSTFTRYHRTIVTAYPTKSITHTVFIPAFNDFSFQYQRTERSAFTTTLYTCCFENINSRSRWRSKSLPQSYHTFSRVIYGSDGSFTSVECHSFEESISRYCTDWSETSKRRYYVQITHPLGVAS